MIKRYLLVVSVFLVIILFTSTSTASIVSSRQRILQRFQQNSVFTKILEKLSQIASSNDNSISTDSDEDEDDDIMEEDGPEENILLPKIWNMVGEITPDDGDDPVVEENDLGETPTIDIDGEEGAYLNDEPTIDINGENGRTIDRVIEIITECNEKFESVLEKVVERTFAPGTTESDGVAENIVDTVVVEGSGGPSESNIVDNVVLTDNGQ